LDLLSKSEVLLLQEKDVFIKKRALAKKLELILKNLSKDVEASFEKFENFQSLVKFDKPKISKGENYQGLPYFVLDCPRYFKPKSMFSFRTLIWWGKEISCSLVISGLALNTLKELVIHQSLKSDFFFCVNSTPWEHHFNDNNYLHSSVISSVTIRNQIEGHGFIKVADKMALDEIDTINTFAVNSLARFLNNLSNHG
jgi:hypothetical protein